MKLRSLLRSRILPLAALLALAAPPSRAAVEIITFGKDNVAKPSYADDHISTSSVSEKLITLGCGDSVGVNITKWGEPQSSYSFNDDAVYRPTGIKWDDNVLSQVEDALGISVATICTDFNAYPGLGGLSLNLSGTHQVGDRIDVFILGHLTPSSSIPYNIGFTSGLDNASLSYAKTLTHSSCTGFYSSLNSSKVEKMQGGVSDYICLRVQGTLMNDCTVNIPLSFTSGGTTYYPYSVGAILYTYDVPEPSSSVLALSGLLLLLRRRRRG